MKRAFYVGLVVFTMFSMIVGCSSGDADDFNGTDEPTEIKFTAVQPLYAYHPNTMQLLVSYTNHAQTDDYDSFGAFYAYYSKEYKDTVPYDFYLLKPGDGITGWLSDCLYKEFQIYKRTEVSDGSVIHEYMMLRDEELENTSSTNAEIEDGESNRNITLSVWSAPVPSTVTGLDYRLEFGNNNDDGNFANYINIYVNETCIATCYYDAVCVVTYGWFSRYFKENLFRG